MTFEGKPASVDAGYLSHEEVQSELFSVLVDLTAFLEEHGLRYSLYGGTLLGAIRHKGFIPWDDDVDICMPRPDFERFRELAGEVPAPYQLAGSETIGPTFPHRYLKFWNTEIRAQEPAFDDLFAEYLWVDVFPIDGVSSDSEEHLRQFERLCSLKSRRIRATVDPKGSTTRVRAILKAIHHAILPTSKIHELDGEIDALLAMHPYEESEMVSSLTCGGTIPWSVERGRFEDMRTVEFNGRNFKVMGAYHEFMSTVYGDYMTPPPENERMTHGTRVWREVADGGAGKSAC